jgi:LacI family transcriptional regulator
MRTSLKDIAKSLNVSIATVSWVLSGQGPTRGVSVAMQEKVKRRAKEMNYMPNLQARSLNTGISNVIGVVIPSISDQFYSSIIREIEMEAEKIGYSIMICSSESDRNREAKMIRTLRYNQVDGIIIATTKQNRREIESFLKEDFPFVLFDRYFSDIETNYIIIDNENSSYQLTRHLIQQGKKAIAFLTTNPHLETMDMRYQGYLRALTEAGIAAAPDLYGFVEFDNYEKNIRHVLDSIFRSVPGVDGFFFATHILALEAFCYFFERSIAYNQFGLACIHEVPTLNVLAPKINVARMPIEDIGKNAVRILHDNIVSKYNKKNRNEDYKYSKMILPCLLKFR